MYRITLYIWQSNSARRIGMTNIDHASIHVVKQMSNRSQRATAEERASYSADLVRNPIPKPIPTGNGFDLTPNVFPRRILSGMNLAGIQAILGPPSNRIAITVKNKEGVRVINLINSLGSGNSDFNEISRKFKLSVPCCYYLALRGLGYNHVRAKQGVLQMRQYQYKHEGLLTAASGASSISNVLIAKFYKGRELAEKLRVLGFS